MCVCDIAGASAAVGGQVVDAAISESVFNMVRGGRACVDGAGRL